MSEPDVAGRAADAIGVTEFSDIRPFIIRAVEHALRSQQAAHEEEIDDVKRQVVEWRERADARGTECERYSKRAWAAEEEIAGLWDALTALRGLVKEGGVPRYTVTPGAALNSVIEEIVDPALRRAALTSTKGSSS